MNDSFKRILLPIRPIEAVYSVLFSIMCLASRHVIDDSTDKSTILTTYFTPIAIWDLVLLPVIAIIAYFWVRIISKYCNRLPKLLYAEDSQVTNSSLTWVILFIFTLILWIPYLMSFWPGGIYNDTLDSIHIALGKDQWSNQNTVLYALWWKLIFFVGQLVNQGDYGGLKLMTIVQPIIMAAVGASFFTWLLNRGIRKQYVYLTAACYALFPIFPYYAVSMWKDTPFSINAFLFTWILFLIIDNANKSGIIKRRYIIFFAISSVLVIFGRNNGLFIFAISTVVILIATRASLPKKTWNTIMITALSILAIALIINGPVYKLAGVASTSKVEKFGIPLQQIGYIVSAGGTIDDESEVIIENILSKEGWINLYSPTVVDSIKFNSLFNRVYFEAHTNDFVRAYVKTIIRNPDLALKGHLLATIGFWDAWKASSSAYICTSHCWNAEYYMSDYFNLLTGRHLADIVGPRWYISSGLLIWLMLLAFTLCINSRSKKYFVVTIPTLSLWLTLMIAAPLAFSFRYVFSLLLCIPIYILGITEGRRNA